MKDMILTKTQIETLAYEYTFDVLSADNVHHINILDTDSDVFVSYMIEEKPYFAMLPLKILLEFKKELIFNRFF